MQKTVGCKEITDYILQFLSGRLPHNVQYSFRHLRQTEPTDTYPLSRYLFLESHPLSQNKDVLRSLLTSYFPLPIVAPKRLLRYASLIDVRRFTPLKSVRLYKSVTPAPSFSVNQMESFRIRSFTKSSRPSL